MKSNVILKTVATIAIVALMSVGNMLGQTSTAQTAVSTTASVSQETGNERLARLMADSDKFPLGLYPPQLLEWFKELGDNPIPIPAVQATSRAVRGPSPNGPHPMDVTVVPDYQVVDLGTLGGNLSYAYGINNKGHVVGTSTTVGYPYSYAFLWQNGSMTDLGALSGGTYSVAYGINDSGQVVGGSDSSSRHRAVLWQNGTITALGTLGGTYDVANNINNNGQVVGGLTDSSGNSHAFLWQNGSLTDMGTLGGYWSEASGINNEGQVVGSFTVLGGDFYAFLWQNGSTNDLGALDGISSGAIGINNSGQIVGDYYNHNNDGFLYSNGSIQDVGALGNYGSCATDINDNGQVVGYSFVSSDIVHAFLYQGGTLYDLNDHIIIPASGWTLQQANAINDAGQIVGTGLNPSGQTHAFLLNPLPIGWRDAVSTTPSQLKYGNYPTKQSGKNNLIVITHGWILKATSPFFPPDQTWVNDMSNNVVAYLNAHGMNDWQVYGYHWEDNAWKYQAQVALYNARGEGANLGSAISVQGWNHVHLIGHSAGAEVIQEASQWIKSASPSTTVQCTFLDAYVGEDIAGVANYGNGTDWSDSYFSHDITGDVTEQPLVNAYNVNVTQLGPKTGITKFRSQTTGQMEVCTRTIKYHGWPIDFYQNTITGNNVDGDYAGFGFPLSKEGGGWSSGVPNYTEGNGTAGHTEGIRVLGTADPTCVNDIHIDPPSWSSLIPSFPGLPTIDSTTGSNQKGTGTLNLTPGSPSWVTTVITYTNPLNTLTFDAQFSGVTNSEDMLTIIWDADTIGSIDERIVHPGLLHYSLRFNNAEANSTHVLSFRLDPYTSAKSSILLTNIALTQVGPALPFTLSVTTNTANGLMVWQLTGESGYAYGIQASTNLASTNWTDIAELVNTNGVVQFYDQDSTNYPMRFYRAHVPTKQ